MSNRETGGPAFPATHAQIMMASGMTVRDYFAAKAMQGLVTSCTDYLSSAQISMLSQLSYRMADAMLETRK